MGGFISKLKDALVGCFCPKSCHFQSDCCKRAIHTEFDLDNESNGPDDKETHIECCYCFSYHTRAKKND